MGSREQVPADDPTHGWNQIAAEFIAIRQDSVIGVAAIRQWANKLPAGARVLDLGCGFGVPLTAALLAQGYALYGVDASAVMLAEFKRRFPEVPVKCASVEVADFRLSTFEQTDIDRYQVETTTFAAVMAIGLLFLLSEQSQQLLIKKVAAVLNQGGLFVFSAPYQQCCWRDLSTGRESRSLGREVYLALCGQVGLTLQSEFSDEGGNHHFSFVKL